MKAILFALAIGLISYNTFATPATPTPVVRTDVEVTEEVTHQAKDQEFRNCKHQADVKKLKGSKRSAFIAACVKK